MKPLIILITLLFGVNSFSIAQVTERDSVTDEHLSALVQAQINNDIPVLRTLIAKNAVITIPGKTGELLVSKKEFLALLKQSGKEQQLCNGSYTVLKRTENSLTAEIEIAYPTFTVLNTVRSRKVEGAWVVLALQKTIADVNPNPAIVMQ